jgi:hypothetical protein
MNETKDGKKILEYISWAVAFRKCVDDGTLSVCFHVGE